MQDCSGRRSINFQVSQGTSNSNTGLHTPLLMPESSHFNIRYQNEGSPPPKYKLPDVKIKFKRTYETQKKRKIPIRQNHISVTENLSPKFISPPSPSIKTVKRPSLKLPKFE
jgi:hypothetical protein